MVRRLNSHELTRRGGLFVLQCQAVVPTLLAPVDEESEERGS